MSLRAVIPLLLLITVKQYKCSDENCIENKKLKETYKDFRVPLSNVSYPLEYCKEECQKNKNCESVSVYYGTISKYCYLCGNNKNENTKGECILVYNKHYTTCFVKCLVNTHNGNDSSVESGLIGEKHEINCGPDHYVKGTSKTSVIAECGYDADKGITQFTFNGEKVECIKGCLVNAHNGNDLSVEWVLIGEKHKINCGPDHYVKGTSETSVTAECVYDADKGITQLTFNGEKVECIEESKFYTQWWFWLIIAILLILIILAIIGFFIYKKKKVKEEPEIDDKFQHIEDLSLPSNLPVPSKLEN